MRSYFAIAAGLLLATGAVQAQVTATVTAVSDYDFRGVSLSGTDPALQGSIDWAQRQWFLRRPVGEQQPGLRPGYRMPTGKPISTSVSPVELRKASAGRPGSSTTTTGRTVTTSNIQRSSWADSYQSFGAKLWYTNDYGNLDPDAWYLEGNFDHDLPSNFSIHAHLGYNYGDYWKDINGDETIDWSIGVGYALGNFTLLLKYVDNETDVHVNERSLQQRRPRDLLDRDHVPVGKGS